MDKNKNIENAKAVFAKNKGIQQLYFTNDGQAFRDIEPAKTHQKEISGSVEGMHLVKNANYEGPAVGVTEDVVKPEDETGKTGGDEGKEE